jgi:23S rRNA (guanosine2251-2'-O)-methyltransferase
MGRKRIGPEQLEGRNPVVECLSRGRRAVHTVWIDQRAKPDKRINRIVELAHSKGVAVLGADRRWLDEQAEGRVHNGVIAAVDALPEVTVNELLAAHASPLFVMADGLAYEHNFGAVLRSSLAFGVDGVIVPTRRGAGLSPVVQRVSMGAVEVVPVVRQGLFAALKPIKRAGIRVIGADMRGVSLTELDMRGPMTLVIGEEGRGLSSKLKERCDAMVRIPTGGNLESLNVSVATAILLYEKRRQDGWYAGSAATEAP